MKNIVIGGRRTPPGAGFLLNDNRASGGRKEEADMLSCSHCQALVNARAWREDGAWCGRCQAPVCSTCGDRMQTRGCEPFLKLIDQQLAESYRRQQNARVLGI